MSWPNLNHISYDTAKLIQELYEHNGFCFQTRLSLNDFIINNFIHAEQEKTSVCKLATQLIEKLDNHIKSIPLKDPKMFTIRRTLQKTLLNLQASAKC